MSPSQRFLPTVPYRLRQRLGPAVDRLAAWIGQPEYRLWYSEYVGTTDVPMDELIALLQGGGFRWGPVSWYHQPPIGTDPDGSWTYRPSPLADRQLHVVLDERASGSIDVYAHEEYNWLRHPVKHARQVGIRRDEGSAEVRRWLESEGVEFDRTTSVYRRVVVFAARVVNRLRARFGDLPPLAP